MKIFGNFEKLIDQSKICHDIEKLIKRMNKFALAAFINDVYNTSRYTDRHYQLTGKRNNRAILCVSIAENQKNVDWFFKMLVGKNLISTSTANAIKSAAEKGLTTIDPDHTFIVYDQLRNDYVYTTNKLPASLFKHLVMDAYITFILESNYIFETNYDSNTITPERLVDNGLFIIKSYNNNVKNANTVCRDIGEYMNSVSSIL